MKSSSNNNSSPNSSSYRNPSRKACEQMIHKILSRELETYGTNCHFKHASDFMIYFESLYPASPSLNKQVQRAVNSMNLPHDGNGYFILNKTAEEYDVEQELAHLLRLSSLTNLATCTPVLLKTDSWQQDHIIHLLESLSEFQFLYESIMKSENGIIIYTKTADKLISYLSSFIDISD